jgi:hypothetical protein
MEEGFVIPAQAGISGQEDTDLLHEIPAFAGMTNLLMPSPTRGKLLRNVEIEVFLQSDSRSALACR